MKTKKLTAILLACAIMFCGCGTAAQTAGEQEKVQEEDVGEEAEGEETAEEKEAEVSMEAEEEAETEGESEEDAETEEAEEEVPVFVEDQNVYGNSIGNIYNNGNFVYNEEDGCLYFYTIYNWSMVKTDPETGDTEVLTDVPMWMYNLYEGKLYSVEITSDKRPGKIYVYDLESNEPEVFSNVEADYLQIADGIIYYVDCSDGTLHGLDIESKEDTVLLEEMVYFPVIYKDIIVFQLDSDKESLYSMPRDGGEITKLNDVRSYNPIIYHDRIYYKALDSDEQYTVRSMNLDGSDEEIILSEGVLTMNLYDGVLYYVPQDTPSKILYIDLSDETREIQDIEMGDKLRSALKDTYGTRELQIVRYMPIQFSGGFMFFTDTMKIDDLTYTDEYLYKIDTGEVFIIPEFCTKKGDTAAQTEAGANESALSGSGQTAEAGANSSSNSSIPAETNQVSDKDAQARAVAQSIADSIPAGSDLERVRAAAAAVAGYCSRATYTSDDPDYKTPYGVLCKGVYTCAGATRALGLVLECMGYSWSHANANQWTHQWCELTMDGQKGWADGMGGLADYGECPFATGGTYTGPDGTTYFVQ